LATSCFGNNDKKSKEILKIIYNVENSNDVIMGSWYNTDE
jgi:hypothetical protein